MQDDQQKISNFLFNCMTQAEQALDGQDPDRMAEALRSILQGAWQLHHWCSGQAAVSAPECALAGPPDRGPAAF